MHTFNNGTQGNTLHYITLQINRRNTTHNNATRDTTQMPSCTIQRGGSRDSHLVKCIPWRYDRSKKRGLRTYGRAPNGIVLSVCVIAFPENSLVGPDKRP